MQKPSIPKGTRDFSPSEIRRRNFIFDIIKLKFEKFGFSPIETPSMEKLSTLTGKYGSEGDQLLFKVLKRGAKFDKAFAESNIENVKEFNRRQDLIEAGFESEAGFDSDSYYPPVPTNFSAPGYVFNNEYGMTNVLEFLAEAFSNERFQIGLAQIPSKVKKRANLFESLWDDFITYVHLLSYCICV